MQKLRYQLKFTGKDPYKTFDEFFKKIESEEELEKEDITEGKLFFGNDTRDEYFHSYRKSSSHIRKRMTPFLEYINLCKHKGILPVPHGFAQKTEARPEIDLNNSLMGDEYAEAFAHTLQFKDSDYYLNLSNSRLTQKGADKIINNIGYSVKKINISYNPQVKDIDVHYLFHILKINLIELNIEGNKVGDRMIIKICETIQKTKHMNFSKNLITDKGAFEIAENLEVNGHLISLNLSWNNIRTKGGHKIFESLAKNSSLKILDLSYNPIGNPKNVSLQPPNSKKPPQSCAFSLSSLMEANTSLVHLDLSHCGFSLEE
jgi:hypothetical protein